MEDLDTTALFYSCQVEMHKMMIMARNKVHHITALGGKAFQITGGGGGCNTSGVTGQDLVEVHGSSTWRQWMWNR